VKIDVKRQADINVRDFAKSIANLEILFPHCLARMSVIYERLKPDAKMLRESLEAATSDQTTSVWAKDLASAYGPTLMEIAAELHVHDRLLRQFEEMIGTLSLAFREHSASVPDNIRIAERDLAIARAEDRMCREIVAIEGVQTL
jgi:hypothetical protein